MAGFFSRLIGGSKAGGTESRGEGQTYKGFTIYATPQRDGAQLGGRGGVRRGERPEV